MKTNHKLWAASYYDRATYPSWWQKDWGPYVELWVMEDADDVRLYMTKQHIIHRVNEDMHGREPLWHVWNLRTDKHVYCGASRAEAYMIYKKQVMQEYGFMRDISGDWWQHEYTLMFVPSDKEGQ